MKRRSIILIALIIIVPLVALTWAMLRISENEHVVVEKRFGELLEDRLQDVNANVTIYFEAAERDLARVTALDNFDVSNLRQVIRTEPRLLQLFVLSSQGQLVYPDPMQSSGPLNGNERMFLIEAAKMFTGQDLKEAIIRSEQVAADASSNVAATNQNQNQNSTATRGVPQQADSSFRLSRSQIDEPTQQEIVQNAYQQAPIQNIKQFQESSGWFVWYWDRGVNLIYWQRRPSGYIVGCALERARWMADLIGQLPDTVSDDKFSSRTVNTRIRMVNESGESVYQWGNFEPLKTDSPFCEVPVAAPLKSWRLQCFVPTSELTAGTGLSAWFSLVAVLSAVATTLSICGFFFLREYARDMRESTQQVSFVNQVSHELKTPLTNIRMYAELLERDLDQVDSANTEKPRERLSVILSEGQRLSRLIGNVLTFARQKRKTLQVQARPEEPCKLIHQIVDRFRPAFADQHIDIQLDCSDETPFYLDPDFLEQILGNLISNVEKYATSGGLLNIKSRVQNNLLIIDVSDAGPGIDPKKRDTVFEPFARISNDVSYAAGTGIGLSIARELAQLHGGNLVLLESDQGCLFRATLQNQHK